MNETSFKNKWHELQKKRAYELTSMNLKESFIETAKEISVDLELNPIDIEFRLHETEGIGVDYIAEDDSQSISFHFHLRVNSKEDDPTKGDTDASLDIDFDDMVAPFDFYEKINFVQNNPQLLQIWGSKVIAQYRNMYQKFDPNVIFRNMRIFVYGLPYDTMRCVQEAKYLINGILASKQEKTTIYKIRHINYEDLYRNFSYAIYIENPPDLYEFWALFPNATGIDSTGAHVYYLEFEKLFTQLKEHIEVDINNVDCEYDLLENFLVQESEGFHEVHKNIPNELLEFDFSYVNTILNQSRDSFENFKRRYYECDYSTALRDLRALVQQALENLCVINSIDFTHISNLNITRLTSLLVERGIIEGRLTPWFKAFTSIANISSHRDFPSNNDLKNEVYKNRIILTFQLGVHLIYECENMCS